ncbi:MAG: O-antigen ligase family protein, partial [Planctomycetales bacterium]|nr:O-antigen ligase family protein [Planctomycetales bacterium]
GTFYSRNSAPQFLACAIGAASGLLVLHRSQKNSRQRDSRYQLRYPSVNVVARFRRRLDELVADLDQLSFLGLLALVTLASGVLIANSRGGILACAVSGAVVILIYALGKQASASSTLGLLLLVACSGLFITFFELDDLIGQRLNTISEEVYRRDNSRLELWRMVLTQPSCWLLGSGLGTFHFAVLPAYDKPQSAWFYHAESVYVELLSNAGLLVLLAVLGGLSWLLWQLLGRTPRSTLARAARLACMFSVLAVALQSFVDFSLILPAVFLPLAALTGAFLGAPAGKQSSSRSSQGSSQRSSGGESRRVSSRAVPRGRVETQASPSSLESRFKMTAVASETPAWKAERLKLAAAAEKLANAPPAETAQETSTSKAFAAATDPRSRVREPDRESSTAAPANQSTLQLHGTLLGCLLLIAVAITLGSPPLRGFAYAEQLSTALNASGGQLGELGDLGGGSRLDGLLNTIEHSPSLAAFPEIRLQLGRYRQEYAALALQSSNTWPQDITPEMRVALSRPEFFSTVFHASDDDAEFQRLREFIQPHQEVVAELR